MSEDRGRDSPPTGPEGFGDESFNQVYRSHASEGTSEREENGDKYFFIIAPPSPWPAASHLRSITRQLPTKMPRTREGKGGGIEQRKTEA